MSVSKPEGLKALAANVDRNNYDSSNGVNSELLEKTRVDETAIVMPLVELDCPEFTSLCPLTGQPDFGSFKVFYQPVGYLIESKSLKLYLGSFRNSGEFHEACTGMIAQDLVNLVQPEWLAVKGVFRPRGGIAINPTAVYGNVPDWVHLKA